MYGEKSSFIQTMTSSGELWIQHLPGELMMAKTSVVTSITGYLPSATAISFSFSPLAKVGQQRLGSAGSTNV